MLSFLVITLVVFLIPETAFAWGPGVHVEMALRALAAPGLLLPAIATLIKAHPEDFIYGATSPDIIVGKRYAGYHYHCHNWRMGKLILSEAHTGRQRAAAYGYLMHLAMDVVAHNYFVPMKIVKSHRARLLSHTYWEMRFDLEVPDAALAYLAHITRHEIDEFDELLERVLAKTLFSFRTNKRIFNSILILQKMKGIRRTMNLYASRSQWEIEDVQRRHYLDLTWDAARDFLAEPESARCLEVDPAGLKKLAYAKGLRRRIRAMVSRRLLSNDRADELVTRVRSALVKGLYRPELKLPDVVDVL